MIRPILHFNPRSREGSDCSNCGAHLDHGISIHAPARGATDSLAPDDPPYIAFQSTLPRGERLLELRRTFRPRHFNPRSREGSDFSRTILPAREAYFNPRSREGSDLLPFLFSDRFWISIHAPARGATSVISCTGGFISDFNPRSREGSDCKRRSVGFFL